jgi:hypothetical protein
LAKAKELKPDQVLLMVCFQISTAITIVTVNIVILVSTYRFMLHRL